MRKGEPGSALVEVIVCSILASAVILGGLDLSTAAIRIAKASLDQRDRAASLSALMGEISSGLISADARQKYGWSVNLGVPEPNQAAFAPPTAVAVTGRFRETALDVRWKEWDIKGRGR
jgi:hypothetical protein